MSIPPVEIAFKCEVLMPLNVQTITATQARKQPIANPNTRVKDMRSWIADLQAAGELIRIDKPVDPLTEMGSLLYQSREKALLFEKLPHGWRSLGQAPANVRHAALAFGTNEEALIPHVAERLG